MLVSVSSKFVFVANLKTASTAIEEALRPYAELALVELRFGKHQPFETIETRFAWLLGLIDSRELFVFGVMRDPIDYMVSLYNSHMDAKFKAIPSLYTGDIDFDRFLGEWVPRNADQATQQYRRFVDKNGRIAANYIVSYTKFEEGLRFVSGRIGIKALLDLNKSNVSPGNFTSLSLNTLQRSRIEELFPTDIKILAEYSNRLLDARMELSSTTPYFPYSQSADTQNTCSTIASCSVRETAEISHNPTPTELGGAAASALEPEVKEHQQRFELMFRSRAASQRGASLQRYYAIGADIIAGDKSAGINLRQEWEANQGACLNDSDFCRWGVIALMWVGEWKAAEQWAKLKYFGGRPCVSFEEDAALGREPLVRFTFRSDRTVRISIPSVYHFRAVRRWLPTLTLVAHYMESTDFVPGSVALGLRDEGLEGALSFCGNRSDQHLVPDFEFLETEGYSEFRATQVGRFHWPDRKPVAYWRGVTTGVREGLGWRTLPRIKLCVIAQAYQAKELFDVGIVAGPHLAEAEHAELRASGLLRKFEPVDSITHYRYCIDIDGFSNSWSGLFRKLLSGTAVLKVRSPVGFRQWYYDRLEEWKHYVPISSDLSDLIEKVKWLRANDDKALEIAKKAQELALSMMYASEVTSSSKTIATAILAQSASASRPDATDRAALTGHAQPTVSISTICGQQMTALAESVRAAFERATVGEAMPDPGVLKIRGMSGKRYRLFISNLVRSLRDARYLEVGVWAGSTLCSAIAGNSIRALAIDNWSQFGGPTEEFLANLSRFKGKEAQVSFLEADFRTVDFTTVGKHNIYLFDGPHKQQDQFDGIAKALPALDDEFVLIVDDWNWHDVREGTLRALQILRLSTRLRIDVRTTDDDSHPPPQLSGEHGDWHNGYMIGVFAKVQ